MTTTDERSFLSRIAANPADDTDRLVYADWLDENAGEAACPRCGGFGSFNERIKSIGLRGDDANATPCGHCDGTGRVPDGRRNRAEFIRVQCGIVSATAFGPVLNETDWRRAGVCPECSGSGLKTCPDCVHWKGRVPRDCRCRGFPYRIDCPACWGSGDIGGLLRAVSAEWNGGGRFDTAVPLRVGFERGFPAAVHCAMPDVVDAAGVPTSWARAVVKYHPVTRFVVGDRRPFQAPGGATSQCSWFSLSEDDGRLAEWCLPPFVFDALPGGDKYRPADATPIALYDTLEAANDALYTALARLAAGS